MRPTIRLRTGLRLPGRATLLHRRIVVTSLLDWQKGAGEVVSLLATDAEIGLQQLRFSAGWPTTGPTD